jgi:hypothetical protein
MIKLESQWLYLMARSGPIGGNKYFNFELGKKLNKKSKKFINQELLHDE